MFFNRPVNGPLHTAFEIRMLALEKYEFGVQLVLKHGGHLKFLSQFHHCLKIRTYSPSRTYWGTRKFFAAILSKELLLSGAYELPYNMLPGANSGAYSNADFA